jgi:hypothetical protein
MPREDRRYLPTTDTSTTAGRLLLSLQMYADEPWLRKACSPAAISAACSWANSGSSPLTTE